MAFATRRADPNLGWERPMLTLFCNKCHKETLHVRFQRAREIAGVSRSTLYYWLNKEWIHWKELPSGRKLVCQDSLIRDGRDAAKEEQHQHRASVITAEFGESN